MKNIMTSVKAIVLDLDGTLLRSDGSVSERTLSVLEQCRACGIQIIVATARFWFKAEILLDIIRPDYAILADGTQIFKDDELFCGFPMEQHQSKGLIEYLAACSDCGGFVVSVGKTLYCSQQGIDEPWRKSIDFSSDSFETVYKIAAVMDSEADAKALAQCHGLRMYSYRGETLYGYTGAGSGKFRSVCVLMERLGIPLTDVIAFGDDENDIEILRYCGTGVAVDNAIDMVKDAADALTESNDEDGVAVFLESILM